MIIYSEKKTQGDRASKRGILYLYTIYRLKDYGKKSWKYIKVKEIYRVSKLRKKNRKNNGKKK